MKDEPPYFLAVDCSGRIGSVAAGRGVSLLAEKIFSGKMRHSSELFGSMEAVLQEAGCRLEEIGAFCFTKGPGSFTGLRIAAATAKMLSFARQIPLISTNTLDTIAHNATMYIQNTDKIPSYLAVILDAKKKNFYAAVYKWSSGYWTKCIYDKLISAEELVDTLSGLENPAVVGEGLTFHSELFRLAGIQILPEEYWPARARSVLAIAYSKYLSGEFENPFEIIPYYISPPEITEKPRKRD